MWKLHKTKSCHKELVCPYSIGRPFLSCATDVCLFSSVTAVRLPDGLSFVIYEFWDGEDEWKRYNSNSMNFVTFCGKISRFKGAG